MKLSVIISNRNDIAMLSVTVRSCLEEFKALPPNSCEIVIADNSDEDIYKNVKAALPTGYCKDKLLKIYHQSFPCLFSARELAAKNSSGKYILCLDSHMLVGRDTILNLLNFTERHENDQTMAFAHAPISWAHQHERNAKHDRDMSVNELGSWNTVYDHERTITWKGMPWICRREWFLDNKNGLNGYGALSKHKISWGGGDMHIGIKPWMLGFKNWAVPTNPCIHIGPFPKIDTPSNKSTIRSNRVASDTHYRLYSVSGNFPHTFGFLVSCYILGGEPMMERNKEAIIKNFGKYIDVTKWWDRAIELGQEEHTWLDEHKKFSFEELLTTQPWND